MKDCPLCPARIVPTSHTGVLLGMFICDDCARRWLIQWDLTHVTPDPSAVAWCLQVHHMKLKHVVDERVARRLVMAEHMGLEVDADDLDRDWSPPWTR